MQPSNQSSGSEPSPRGSIPKYISIKHANTTIVSSLQSSPNSVCVCKTYVHITFDTYLSS
jgi:hypothetical protein